MGGGRFAVIEKRGTRKDMLIQERTMEGLTRELDELMGWDPGNHDAVLLAVEFRQSGYTEIARGRRAGSLKRKMEQKTGIR